jgi:hypothetical protein
MERRYVIVRKNSTTGAYIVERNHDAPQPARSKADISGYAETLFEAQRIAREANSADEERAG